MKTIYLIRHGETDYNLRGVVQGSGVDSDLNDTGRRQADAFFQAYKHINFDRVYTSALKRTTQSVAQFIERGIPYETYAGLNELSWGEMEGKTPNYLADGYYLNLVENWRNGITNLPAHGGESPDQVQARQLPVIDLWKNRTDETTTLVCMHGRAMRILLTSLFKQPLSKMDDWEHANLCLYKILYDGKTFTPENICDISHLQSIAV